MNGKTLLAILLGAITHFILGFLIYGLLLMDFMMANTVQYEGLMVEGSAAIGGYALNSIFYAMLLTYIFLRAGIRTGRNGLIMAAVVTLLFGAAIDSMFYFGMNLYSGIAVLVDLIAFTVMGSITGFVVAYILNRGHEKVRTGASVA